MPTRLPCWPPKRATAVSGSVDHSQQPSVYTDPSSDPWHSLTRLAESRPNPATGKARAARICETITASARAPSWLGSASTRSRCRSDRHAGVTQRILLIQQRAPSSWPSPPSSGPRCPRQPGVNDALEGTFSIGKRPTRSSAIQRIDSRAMRRGSWHRFVGGDHSSYRR